MTHITVVRPGDKLALSVPDDVVARLDLHEGDQVEVSVDARMMTVRPVRARITAESMFAGKAPAEWRALYAGAYDWGPDVGREIIEE